jgi:hypothetical protein
MKIFRRPDYIFVPFLAMPLLVLISKQLTGYAGLAALVLIIGNVATAAYDKWRDKPLKQARLAAVLAARPAYVTYGSGAPKWIGLPIFVGFFAIVCAAMAPQILHPYVLKGFNGFLTHMADIYVFPIAAVTAFATWRAIAWRLRRRYKDIVLAAANDEGIMLPSGFVIPYANIRRIDPYSKGSNGLVDNWIQVEDVHFARSKIDVNMSLEAPAEILAALRERALAGGATLAPELPNGRMPTVGTQLGYRIGRGWQG